MLVLHRMSGQSIIIGKRAEIIVKVLKNESGIVSIGIDAPITDRLEVYEQHIKCLPSADNSKIFLLNRLEKFEKRIKKFRKSLDFSLLNDSAMSQDFCSG